MLIDMVPQLRAGDSGGCRNTGGEGTRGGRAGGRSGRGRDAAVEGACRAEERARAASFG